MRVKVFANEDYEKLECEVNLWLEENPDRTVQFVCQSECREFWTISIWHTHGSADNE